MKEKTNESEDKNKKGFFSHTTNSKSSRLNSPCNKTDTIDEESEEIKGSISSDESKSNANQSPSRITDFMSKSKKLSSILTSSTSNHVAQKNALEAAKELAMQKRMSFGS